MAAVDTDDIIYIKPQREWFDNSMVSSAQCAYGMVHQLDPPLLDLDDRRLQYKLYKHMMETIPSFAPFTLATRIKTSFEIELDDDVVSSWCSGLVRANANIPRFVQSGFYRSLHNAWNTSSRFGDPSHSCKWCKKSCSDDLRHYLVCPTMVAAMHQICPALVGMWCSCLHPPLVVSVQPAAFGIGVQSTAWIQLVVVWHDLLHHCYSLAKYSNFDGSLWINAFKARRRVWHRFAPAVSQLLEQFLNRI